MPEKFHLMADRLKYAAWWRITVAVGDGCYGLVILFGTRTAEPYQLWLNNEIPLPVFAAGLVVASSLLLTKRLRAGGVLGAIVWASFGLASVVVAIEGIALTKTGPIVLYELAVFHLLITQGAVMGIAPTKNE